MAAAAATIKGAAASVCSSNGNAIIQRWGIPIPIQLPFPLPTDDAYPIQPSMQKATWVALLRSYNVYAHGAFDKFTGYHRDRTNLRFKIV